VEEPLERGRGISGAEDSLGVALKSCGVLVEQGIEGDDTMQVALDDFRAQPDQLLNAGHRYTSRYSTRERKSPRQGLRQTGLRGKIPTPWASRPPRPWPRRPLPGRGSFYLAASDELHYTITSHSAQSNRKWGRGRRLPRRP